MASQKRYKSINFDLDTKELSLVFGENKYRKGYSLIQRFFVKNGFLHHQYSGYISRSAMSYGEIYILITDKMISEFPWIIGCVNKFDATNVTSRFVSTSTDFHAVLANMNRDSDADLDGSTVQDTVQVSIQDERRASLLAFCSVPRTRDEMQQHVGIANRGYFRKNILNPLLESGRLRMTIPDKPNSKNQQYVAVARTGLEGE